MTKTLGLRSLPRRMAPAEERESAPHLVLFSKICASSRPGPAGGHCAGRDPR